MRFEGHVRGAIENHIREADAFFRPLFLQSAERLIGGERLMTEFDRAVSACRKYGRRQVSGLIERVNELCVARHLLIEPNFATALIEYEPEIVIGPKFDFVIRKSGEPPHYVEVKTVSPLISMNEISWRKAKFQPRLVVLDMTFVSAGTSAPEQVTKAVQSAFLRNTVETELKLANHALIEPGPGTLIYCGDGQSWDQVELRDFVKVNAGAQLGFGLMLRPQDAVSPSLFDCPAFANLLAD
jgi:hypothetical protein